MVFEGTGNVWARQPGRARLCEVRGARGVRTAPEGQRGRGLPPALVGTGDPTHTSTGKLQWKGDSKCASSSQEMDNLLMKTRHTATLENRLSLAPPGLAQQVSVRLGTAPTARAAAAPAQAAAS